MSDGLQGLRPEDLGGDDFISEKKGAEFGSEEDEQAYNVGILIEKARELLRETGVAVPSKEEVLIAAETILTAHRQKLNVAFRTAIGDQFDTQEKTRFKLESAMSYYEAFIDGLKLSGKLAEPDAAKLKEMMSEANYVNAVETAREMEASRIPTYEQIVEELMTFTPDRLRNICEMMEKPKLLIVADRGFDENIAAMNANKHYTSASGKPQENASVYENSDSPYNKLSIPGKVRVGIADGVAHPKQLTKVSAVLGERRNHLTAKYAAKRMSNIYPRAMVALIQQSLREAEMAKNNGLIVDNFETVNGTTTIMEPDGSIDLSFPPVTYAYFNSYGCQARFCADNSKRVRDDARGRAWMQVLEL